MSKLFSSLFHAPHPHAGLSSSKPSSLSKSASQSLPLSKHEDAALFQLSESEADTSPPRLKSYPTGWYTSTVPSPASPDRHIAHPTAHANISPLPRSPPPIRIPHLPPRPASHSLVLGPSVTSKETSFAPEIIDQSNGHPKQSTDDKLTKHVLCDEEKTSVEIITPLSLATTFESTGLGSPSLHKKAKIENGTSNGTYSSNGKDPPDLSSPRRPKKPPPPPLSSTSFYPSSPTSAHPTSPLRTSFANHVSSPPLLPMSSSAVSMHMCPTSPSPLLETTAPSVSPETTSMHVQPSSHPSHSSTALSIQPLPESPLSSPESSPLSERPLSMHVDSTADVSVSTPLSPALDALSSLPSVSLHVYPDESFVSLQEVTTPTAASSPSTDVLPSSTSLVPSSLFPSPTAVALHLFPEDTVLTVNGDQASSSSQSGPTPADSASVSAHNMQPPTSPSFQTQMEFSPSSATLSISITPAPSSASALDGPLAEFGDWATTADSLPPLSPSKFSSPIQYRPVARREPPMSLPCLLYEPPGSDLLPHRVVYINSKRAVLVKLDFPIMYYRYLDSGCLNHRDFAFDTALFAVECDPKTYEQIWEYSDGLGCEGCSLKAVPSQSNFQQAVKFCEACGMHYCRACDFANHPRATLKGLHVRTMMADIQICHNLLGEEQASAFDRTGPFRNQQDVAGSRTTTLEQFLARLQDIADAPDPEEPVTVVPVSDSDSEDEHHSSNSRFLVVEDEADAKSPTHVLADQAPSMSSLSSAPSPRTESIKHLADALRQEQAHQADLLQRFQSSCQDYQSQFTSAFDQLVGRISCMLSDPSTPSHQSSSVSSSSSAPFSSFNMAPSYSSLFSCPPSSSSCFPSASSFAPSPSLPSSTSYFSAFTSPFPTASSSSAFSSPFSSSIPSSPSSSPPISSPSSSSFFTHRTPSPIDTALSPSSFLSPSFASPLSDSSPSALAFPSPVSPSPLSPSPFNLSPASQATSAFPDTMTDNTQPASTTATPTSIPSPIIVESPTATTSTSTLSSPRTKHRRSNNTHSLNSCSAASGSSSSPLDDLDMWRTCFTAEGKKYYWNTLNDETSWIKPRRRQQRMPAPGTFGLSGVRLGSCRTKSCPRSSSTPPVMPSSSFMTAPISLVSSDESPRRRSATGLSLLARRIAEDEDDTRSHTDTELHMRSSSPRRRRSTGSMPSRNSDDEDGDSSPSNSSPAPFDSPSESSDDPFSPREAGTPSSCPPSSQLTDDLSLAAESSVAGSACNSWPTSFSSNLSFSPDDDSPREKNNIVMSFSGNNVESL